MLILSHNNKQKISSPAEFPRARQMMILLGDDKKLETSRDMQAYDEN